jgi:hypothetical protein
MNIHLPKLVISPALQADSGDVDFTIVIAHRGNPMGLWATVHSCEMDLEDTSFKYNYVIVPNGVDKVPPEDEQLKIMMERGGTLRDWIFSPEPMSPPTARQLGAESANGKFIAFFDNHCLIKPGYFKRAYRDMEGKKMDMLHSTTRFYMNHESCYHYKISKHLQKNFWGDAATEPMEEVPYRMAMGGHGGFIIRKKVWDEVGGYGPLGLLDGYGGEESLLDLKMWMLGKEIWIDPKLIHYHYNGLRGYSRHYTNDYYRNMMMAAYIIGGEAWQHKVYMSFMKDSKSREVDLFDCFVKAQERGAGYAKWLEGKRQKTLDELLEWFPTQNVAF